MRNSTVRGVLLAMATVAGLSACGGNQPDPGVIPDAPTMVRVENQSGDDMTIYVVKSGQRLRLGARGSVAEPYRRHTVYLCL